MSPLSPKEWFDQFGENGTGLVGEQWCRRHWAPCPVFGANGIMASIMMMSAWSAQQHQPGMTPGDMNALMTLQGALCCVLGDDAMYEIWGECPPA